MNHFLENFRLFFIFLRLGLTSFGGPVAHIGFFHEAFVQRRKWLSEQDYSELVSLCQILPGPASSQIGMSIGLMRGGISGALAAWLGFTLPSALFMTAFAFVLSNFQGYLSSALVRGLKLAAVAVVAQALISMTKSLCPDLKRKLLACALALPLIFFGMPIVQFAVIILGACIGVFFLPEAIGAAHKSLLFKVPKRTALICLSLLLAILCLLPLTAGLGGNLFLILFDKFYRAGALVFGGGHVVLPLLASEFVEQKIVSKDVFLAGYGAAQAIPGPLFSFAGFLGAASVLEISTGAVQGIAAQRENGLFAAQLFNQWLPWAGAGVSLVAVFLPSFLLVIGAIPFWEKFKDFHAARRVITGINAAVVGLLLAALIHPVSSTAITNSGDVSIVLLCLALLYFFRTPSWLIVLLSAALTSLAAA